jgi:glutamate synthase (ferredoxin)
VNKSDFYFAFVQTAQIFEILGLNKTFTSNIFLHAIQVEGIGLMEVEKEVKKDIKSLSKFKVSVATRSGCFTDGGKHMFNQQQSLNYNKQFA